MQKKIKKHYLPFFLNCQKVAKYPYLTFSVLEKIPLERFNEILLLQVHHHPPWETSCQNKAKVIKNGLQVKNEPNLTYPTFKNDL